MKRILIFMTLAAFSVPIHAAILATVPRQGSMLMPEVYYHENTDSVTVDLSAINVIAQLTPLLVSNPNDSFNPADPWFQYLDPSQQGLAFSRRYGFDMDVMSDYVPDNRALWIRNLGSSPALSFFDYNDYVYPLTWNPILGTAGTSMPCIGMKSCGTSASPRHREPIPLPPSLKSMSSTQTLVRRLPVPVPGRSC